jgi:hypothetical protein
LEIYALNQSLALSSSAKDFADRYSYFSIHGSPKLERKINSKNVRNCMYQKKTGKNKVKF